MYGFEQATCAGGSLDALLIPALVEVRHTDIRELQPRVMLLPPRQVELQQSPQQLPCADQATSCGCRRSDFDPRGGEHCIGTCPAVRVVGAYRSGGLLGPVRRLVPV